MAVYTMPLSVAALVPAEIKDRVQNGLDTTFSEAVKSDASAKWKASVKSGTKDKPATIKIGSTLKRSWEVQQDRPGLFLMFSIGIENLERDCGQFKFELPDFAVVWFKQLTEKAAKDKADAAAAKKP